MLRKPYAGLTYLERIYLFATVDRYIQGGDNGRCVSDARTGNLPCPSLLLISLNIRIPFPPLH